MKNLNKLLLIALFNVIGVSISNAQCTSSFNYVDNGSGNYTFTSTSSGGLNFNWKVDNNYVGTGTIFTNTFTNGNHNVCLFIEDSMAGCWDNTCQTITVTAGVPCVSSFNYVDNGGGNYTFTSTSSGGTSFIWLIDGAWSGNGTSISPTFYNGTHTICLTILNSAAGCSNTSCQTITVTSGTSCSASFNYVDNGNGNYTFTSTSSGGLNMGWFIGGSNVASGNSFSYNFTNGNYMVCLGIADTNTGCYDTVCQAITVTSGISCNINAGFSFVDNGLGNYSFTNTTTGSGSLSYYWNFGDGNTSTAVNPTHTFAANTTYVVVLAVSDSSSNCASYYSVVILVTGNPSPLSCNAGFVIYPDSAQPSNVIVVNSSTGINLTYFWDFGDGNTSTLQYPNYTYSTAGPFLLCLTITDAANTCTSSFCDSIYSGGVIWKQSGFTINVISPTATGIENEVELVSDFEIYPNPVTNNLSIDLSLTQQATVKVFVTDLLGKQISLITNETFPAGNNKLQWTPSNISNGIYLLNIKTNNSLQVNKLVLNR
ncbi:MAG: hypothetical protein COX70_07285 [Flavobacteriales bacterium CG_4_10_14_0_2_um_filter_32_8]|nr:MAG: hypothetical protein COX70_07285 [Flavobacteriales bacterium CG_4_10_14_0_2_um_filter_32_8]PJB15247.1 MAG: hypothetical protein CO118_04420 [Flavobacteriales bacterium CG_4_9_14_3_um_filter_32_8]